MYISGPTFGLIVLWIWMIDIHGKIVDVIKKKLSITIGVGQWVLEI